MKLILKGKKTEAKDTVTFKFESYKDFNYLPGQYIYITLPFLIYPDDRGPTRHFTISTSPTEGNRLLTFTTRIRNGSGFKQSLAELTVGEEIEAEGPNGTYILDENEIGSHVFIAGGIGITPFRSFLKYSFDKNLSNRFHLIYSNSTPDDITFRKEIESWGEKYNNFKVDMLITKPEKTKSWTGKTGRIDKNLLNKLIESSEIKKSTFWICGPPEMVSSIEDVVKKLNIQSSRVRSEKFTGY